MPRRIIRQSRMHAWCALWIVLAASWVLLPSQNHGDETPQITCRLSADSHDYTVNDEAVPSIRITNQTDHSIWLVRALDGSTRGSRYPKISLSVTAPSGQQQPVGDGSGGCGFVNPLRSSDFVNLASGEAFDPFRGWTPWKYRFPAAGRYVFHFQYSTDSSPPSEGWRVPYYDEPQSKELLARLDTIERVTISCILEITVAAQ